MLKAVILGSASSIHTIRWANGLSLSGVKVILISAHPIMHGLNDDVVYHQLKFSPPLGYLFNAIQLRILIASVNPDLINVHYASGYGTLSRFLFSKRILLSVWGSDVYDFPAASIFHRMLLKSNLKSAKAIASTSKSMAAQVASIYNHNKIFITPFGVDVERFRKINHNDQNRSMVIGTVKTLEYKYGIDTLLDAFKIVKTYRFAMDLKLLIAGIGKDELALKKYAKNLSLGDSVEFIGHVNHNNVPSVLNRMDIYVALSRLDSESFGVALIEASATELPLVVSDVSGPSEVVINNYTGIIVERNNSEQAAHAIIKLLLDKKLCAEMGKNGRNFVVSTYNWNSSIQTMLNAYSYVAGYL